MLHASSPTRDAISSSEINSSISSGVQGSASSISRCRGSAASVLSNIFLPHLRPAAGGVDCLGNFGIEIILDVLQRNGGLSLYLLWPDAEALQQPLVVAPVEQLDV